jgi:hypothetical protein
MIVTLADLDTALDRATADFRACGLYTAAMDRVPVRLTLAGSAYGWCLHDGSRIDIPALSLARLGELFGRPRVALADVVRHELAHALAFLHPELVAGRRFAQVFGGHHDDEWDAPPRYRRAHFVSEYATSSPCEDFAETVMVYTRHRGRVRSYARRPGVHRAFEYVTALGRRLRRTGLLHSA